MFKRNIESPDNQLVLKEKRIMEVRACKLQKLSSEEPQASGSLRWEDNVSFGTLCYVVKTIQQEF